MAVIVIKPGMQVTPTEIKAHIRDLADKGLTSSYAVPEHIVFVEELPKTSVGKHDKKRLRERFGK